MGDLVASALMLTLYAFSAAFMLCVVFFFGAIIWLPLMALTGSFWLAQFLFWGGLVAVVVRLAG